MIQELIDFTSKLFPSIDPYTKEQVKKALYQFESSDKKFECFVPTTFSYLAQGDIFDSLPFRIYDKDGNEHSRLVKGMLISNTCHAENQNILSFVPLLPVGEYKIDRSVLLKNITYSLLYFPDPLYSEIVVDFNIVNSFHKDMIINLMKEKRIRKVATLNRFGYYMFLTKLTIHFMRPEDPGVQEERQY